LVGSLKINAFIGVKMEMGAEAALEALQKQNPPLCEVRRDGQIKNVPSETLVSGDVVMLATGKKIPADMRLVKSSDLQCNEMALTGESEPVNKDATWRGEKIHTGEEKKESTKEEKATKILQWSAQKSVRHPNRNFSIDEINKEVEHANHHGHWWSEIFLANKPNPINLFERCKYCKHNHQSLHRGNPFFK